MSEKLQELICYMGQTEVFDQASQTLKHILGIEISDRQIGRVSEFYGEKIEQQMVEYDPEVLPKIKLKSNRCKSKESQRRIDLVENLKRKILSASLREEEEKSELSGQRSLEGMNFAIAELTTRKETWATDL